MLNCTVTLPAVPNKMFLHSSFCLGFESKMFSVCCFLISLQLSVFLQGNPDYDSTFVFENDFPALQPDAPDPGEF